MHLKTFSKLEYVGIGQGKMSVTLLLTATQSLESLPKPDAAAILCPGDRALDQVFVIFCF